MVGILIDLGWDCKYLDKMVLHRNHEEILLWKWSSGSDFMDFVIYNMAVASILSVASVVRNKTSARWLHTPFINVQICALAVIARVSVECDTSVSCHLSWRCWRASSDSQSTVLPLAFMHSVGSGDLADQRLSLDESSCVQESARFVNVS